MQDTTDEWNSLREKIIGLGERSVQKSYYPELQQQINELKRFRALLDQSNDAIFLLDLSSGLIADVNQSTSKQLEFTHDELLKMFISDLVISYDADKIKTLLLGLNNKETFRKENITTIFLKKSGEKIPVEISISTVEFDDDLYAVMVARDIAERKKAEKQIKQSLKEKEVLLKEIHHRVKNNLQIVSSLLNLQQSSIEGEKTLEVFKESQNRIKSMALIHEKLYQSEDLTKIDFPEYIRSLVYYLFKSYAVDYASITHIINVEEVFFDIDISIPCGLIINELISNSLKYAFPDGRKGEIKIDLYTEGEKSILKISDNGIGLPEGVNFKNTETLGLRLVNILVNQIDGKMELNNTNGTSFKIEFINVPNSRIR